MISKGYLMHKHLYISDLHVLLIMKMFIWNVSKQLKLKYLCQDTSAF